MGSPGPIFSCVAMLVGEHPGANRRGRRRHLSTRLPPPALHVPGCKAFPREKSLIVRPSGWTVCHGVARGTGHGFAVPLPLLLRVRGPAYACSTERPAAVSSPQHRVAAWPGEGAGRPNCTSARGPLESTHRGGLPDFRCPGVPRVGGRVTILGAAGGEQARWGHASRQAARPTAVLRRTGMRWPSTPRQ